MRLNLDDLRHVCSGAHRKKWSVGIGLVSAALLLAGIYFAFSSNETIQDSTPATFTPSIFQQKSPEKSLREFMNVYLREPLKTSTYEVNYSTDNFIRTFGDLYDGGDTYTEYRLKKYHVFAFVAEPPGRLNISEQLIGGGFVVFVKDPELAPKQLAQQLFRVIPDGEEYREGPRDSEYEGSSSGQTMLTTYQTIAIQPDHQSILDVVLTESESARDDIYPGDEAIKRVAKLRYFILLPHHPWLKRNDTEMGLVEDVRGFLDSE